MGGHPPVPIFPLRTVLVPGMVLPLHIFEPRYRLMIRTLCERADDERGFGIVAIRPGADPCSGRGSLYDLGTMARITEVKGLPDGRYDIVTVGARRFSIDDGGREPAVPAGDRPAASRARRATPRGRRRWPGPRPGCSPSTASLIAEWGVIDLPGIDHLPTDPVVLSYLVGSAVVVDLPAAPAAAVHRGRRAPAGGGVRAAASRDPRDDGDAVDAGRGPRRTPLATDPRPCGRTETTLRPRRPGASRGAARRERAGARLARRIARHDAPPRPALRRGEARASPTTSPP